MGGVSVVGRSNPACSTFLSFLQRTSVAEERIASLSNAKATHSLAMTLRDRSSNNVVKQHINYGLNWQVQRELVTSIVTLVVLLAVTPLGAQFLGSGGASINYDNNALREQSGSADVITQPYLSLGYKWNSDFTFTKLRYSGQGSILARQNNDAYMVNDIALTHHIQVNHRDPLLLLPEVHGADEISVMLGKVMEELDGTDYPRNKSASGSREDPDEIKDDVLDELLIISDKLDKIEEIDKNLHSELRSTLTSSRARLLKAYGQSTKLSTTLTHIDALQKKVNAYKPTDMSGELTASSSMVFDVFVSPHASMGNGTLTQFSAGDIILATDRDPIEAIATADVVTLGLLASRRANKTGSVYDGFDNARFEGFGEYTHFFTNKLYGVASYTLDRTLYNDYPVATNTQHHFNVQARGYVAENIMLIGELGYAFKHYDDTIVVQSEPGKKNNQREIVTPKSSLVTVGGGAFVQAGISSVVGFTLYTRAGVNNRLLDSTAILVDISQDPFSYKSTGMIAIYRQALFHGIDGNFSFGREGRVYGATAVKTIKGGKKITSSLGNGHDDEVTTMNALFLRSFEVMPDISLDLDFDLLYEINSSTNPVNDYTDFSVAFGAGLSW